MVERPVGGQQRSRAQLILIAAILVALTVLAAVVLLNVVHDAPGLSAQQETQSVNDAQTVTTQVQSDLDRLFLVRTSVSQIGSEEPYAYQFPTGKHNEGTRFSETINSNSGDDHFSNYYGFLVGTNSRAFVEFEYLEKERRANGLEGSVNGSVAYQDTDKPFTYPSINPTLLSCSSDKLDCDYNIIEDAQSVPRFKLNITDTDNTGTPTRFIIEGSSDQAEIDIDGDTASGTPTTVTVTPATGPSDSETFSNVGDDNPVRIDITDGVGVVQNNTDRYPAKSFGEGLSPPYTVRVEEGDKAEGNYTITAGKKVSGTIDSRIKENPPPERAEFEVDWLTAPSTTYTQGVTEQFELEVRNTGAFEDTQYIVVKNASSDRVLAAKEQTVSAGDAVTTTLTWEPTGNFSGNEDFKAETYTHSATQSIQVVSGATPAQKSEYNITSVSFDSRPPSDMAGGNYTVEFEVNGGNGNKKEQTVALKNFDDEVVNSTTIDPPVGGTASSKLTWQTPVNNSKSTGELNLTIEDDSWNSTDIAPDPEELNPTRPYVIDSEMTPDIDQDPIVNPKFNISYTTPDINYETRFALYNRTEA